MLYKFKLFFLFLMCIVHQLSAQTVFQKKLNLPYNGSAASIQQTKDNNFIILASKLGVHTMYLIKVDQNGDTIWTKGYSTGREIEWLELVVLDDGGYITCNTSYPDTNYNYSLILQRMDSLGNIIWSKELNSINNSFRLNDFKQLPDGGFIISTQVTDTLLNFKIGLIRLDSNGNFKWYKIYKGFTSGYSFSTSLITTADSGFAITGTNITSHEGYLMKIDSLGNFSWRKKYNAVGNNYFNKLIQTLDGGYMIVGATDHSLSQSKLFLLKTDSNGDTLWSHKYGGYDFYTGEDIEQLDDSSFITCGASADSAFNLKRGFVARFDQMGNSQWTELLLTNADLSSLRWIDLTQDEGFISIFQGYIDTTYLQFGFMKMDSIGNAGCNQVYTQLQEDYFPFNVISDSSFVIIDTVVSQHKQVSTNYGFGNEDLCLANGIKNNQSLTTISVFPNPFNDKIQLSNIIENTVVSIYDINGKEVIRRAIFDTDYSLSLNVPSGIYFLRLLYDNRVFSTKLIKTE